MRRKKAPQKNFDHLYRHIGPEIRARILSKEAPDFDRIGPITIPSQVGDSTVNLTLYYFVNRVTSNQYFLITRNSSLKFKNPKVRISSNCFYGFIINSRRCDCRWQFDEALRSLSESRSRDFAIIFAVNDHGKGIEGGLRGHALLYALGQALGQELVFDAYEKNGFQPEYRDYGEVAKILRSLEVSRIRLLTNNPDRVAFFRENGFRVTQVSLEKPYDEYLSEELGVKKTKLGHKLELHGFSRKDVEIYGLTENVFE